MVENIVPLREALPSQAGAVSTELKEFVDIILREDVPIICINKDTGKKRSMPFKALYDNNSRFWLQSGAWEYFLAPEDLANIREKLAASKAGIWKPGAGNTGTVEPKAAVEAG